MGLRIGVVSINPNGESGGAWTFAAMLREALASYDGPHVFIDMEDLAPPKPRKYSKGVLQEIPRVQDLAYLMINAPLPEPDNLETRIRRGNLDILWFTYPGGEPVSIPYIATVWDLEHRKQPYFPEVSTTGWLWQDRDAHYNRLLPRAAIVVTGTQAGKDEIVRYYSVNAPNVVVIPFPAPGGSPAKESASVESDVKYKFGIESDFLFYPAQFWPHKNHINLLYAFKILREERHLDLTLLLTGSDQGNFKYVAQTAASLGLSDRTLTPGFVDRADVLALYATATALVYPSYFGPDNLPPLEAFAAGCPVAAGDIEGAKEYLGGAALLFDPSDPVDIADKIALLISAPELRNKLINKGTEIVQQRTPKAYITGLCRALDKFEKIRRSWGAEYRHS